jgi:flagellar biosynthesis/type III secretory pathway chaperone
MDLKNKELISALVDTLDSLVKVYRSLLEVVRREKDILVSAKLDDLTENNKAKDAMLLRIRSLENNRQKLARDLAQVVGADVEQPRLLEIAAKLETQNADRLRNLHGVLDLLVKRVSEVNKSNEELVQAALRNITGAMDAIRDSVQEKPAYGRKGKMAGSATGGNLVRKEG